MITSSFILSFSRLQQGRLYGLRQVLYVALVHSRHADSAGGQQIDVVLVYQQPADWFAEASEGKHADLVSDVLPSPGSLDAL